MNTNGFREDELITRKVNGQTKVFPIVGGRLRLAHEENQNLNLQTEMVSWDGQYAIFKCCAVTTKGQFVGYGTANSQRDSRLAESLIELAETRSVARALRFAGFGLEFTGAEEVSHVNGTENETEQTSNKRPERVFDQGNGQSKAGTNTEATENSGNGNGSKPLNGSIGKATQAQCRALFALTKRANFTDQDIESMLRPLNANTFQDLSRESASQLITYLQTQVAA
jgi:hypothetical protein